LISVLRLLETLEQGQTVKLEKQDPQRFRYYRLPEQEVFTELERRGVQVVSYSVYSEFIRQFVAPEFMARFSPSLQAIELEGLVNRLKTAGVEQTLSSFNTQMCASMD
jgi:hypothetical protein